MASDDVDPPVFSACSVYVQYQNKEYLGSIDRYNIEYYTMYSASSEFDNTITHQTAMQPLFVDIPVSSDGKYSSVRKHKLHTAKQTQRLLRPYLVFIRSSIFTPFVYFLLYTK